LSNIYTGEAGAQSSIYSNTSKGVSSAVNNLFSDKDFKSWLTSGNSSVSDNSIYNNAAYQNAAFASQPAGTYGPWQ
jgi:hypothetical protein